MGADTSIEWADHTFNPWTGCQPASPGCAGCYAAAWAKRAGRDFAERRRTTEANWRWPLRWEREHSEFFALHRRRQQVFCASLADVFDNQVPPEWRADLFRLIESTPNLDWLLLTKRVGNAAEMMFKARGGHLPLLPNLWLGATIVNREEMLRDGPKLKAAPAAVRFWSVEPMLGDLGWIPCELLPDWIICGGESGSGARPMHPAWVRNVRDQCAEAGVPFHFKQWGDWAPVRRTAGLDASIKMPGQNRDIWAWPDGTRDGWRFGPVSMRIGKKAAGRELDGREHDDFPRSAV